MKRILRIVAAVFAVVLLVAAALIFWQTRSPSFEPYASSTLPVAGRDTEGAIRAQFFGTATILLGDGETSVLVDGFFSRPAMATVLFGKVAPDEARIDRALSSGQVQKVDALLVAHSHYDHALDSAVVARKTGALLAGSESTANIGRGAGLGEDRIRVVKNGESMKVGAFEVVFYETPHSPNPLFPGDIEQPLRPPAKSSDYKLGKNYSYLLRHPRGNVLIVPSANYVPGLFDDVRVSVVFLGIAALGKQPEEFTRTYWHEVVKKTGATLVVPIHWDHFGVPLDEALRPLPYFMDDMRRSMPVLQQLAKADGVTIGFAPLFKPFVCIGPK
jgi:L-ascorbate metabolism protein UlaG (beta-lactamase superfamily)